MSEQLLPCPFCGCKAEMLAYSLSAMAYSLSAMVRCTNCNVQTQWHKGAGAEIAAVAAWNRRVPAPQGVSVPDKIRRELSWALELAEWYALENSGGEADQSARLERIRQLRAWLNRQSQELEQTTSWANALNAARRLLVISAPDLRVTQYDKWHQKYAYVISLFEKLDAQPQAAPGQEGEERS